MEVVLILALKMLWLYDELERKQLNTFMNSVGVWQ